MHGVSFCVFLMVVLMGSFNMVLCDEPTLTTAGDTRTDNNLKDRPNKYYNVLLRRRSHTTKEFYAYVEKVRGMHMDPNRPKFRAEIVRVLLNMKTITVKNPSKNALKFFNSDRDIVDMVTEEEKDIEGEL
jgi:hypothetical protein